jgi:spore cortex biosynthesis protein YabQ
MLFATIGQAWYFLAAVYGGIAIGALYDLCRMARDAMRAGHGATMAVDAVFWLLAGAAMFATLWYAGLAELRVYMLLGFACGWALYTIALSRVVMAIYRLVKKMLARIADTRFGKRLLK